MPRSKPPLVPLHELTVGQEADFFALLAEKVRGARRDGKPFYTCRFRDARRTVAFMAWSDGPYFAACEQDWQEGDFYKIRGCYEEHKVYGPQIAIEMIRPVTPADLADGFDPGRFIECSRYDRDAMFAELIGLAEAHIGDGPLRKLVLSLLERHRDALRRIPATLKHFHPFCGGWLEHTLSVTHSCLHLV
ncbi:MAG: hypothetical protein FJ271_10765 [Planctomycetes bacterium]|nr:hypothetical protein [Planctomycetota bacterium]